MSPTAKKVNMAPYEDPQEERLQRLEDRNTEVVSKIAGVDIRLGYIDKAIQSVGDKIDDMMSPILNKIDGINTRADEHSKVIERLNEEAEAKKVRVGKFKKLIYAAMLAGAGVGGQHLYVWISHFFTH
jgi:DNA anti-recombination protein RmuC